VRQMKPSPREILEEHKELAVQAEKVLRQNDVGDWTRAAPGLYPHQWSWDSAFIAIGLAHLDVGRAARELRTLFAHQWRIGKVPHIVFNPKTPPHSYYPGADYWACAAASPDAPPAPPYTSCLIQPPVHAIAVSRIWEAAWCEGEEVLSSMRDFLHDIYPKLFAWHRYLATARDPEGSGLVTIYHPWESGTDSSPRWDGALSEVEVGDLPPYPRYDVQHVGDPSQRPTNADYDRYLWLVKLIKDAGCTEKNIYRSHPFLVKDVLFSAILVAANEALLNIAEVVGAPDRDRKLIARWVERGRWGLAACWDEDLKLCLDYDLRAAKPLRSRTVAGFAPLVAGDLRPRHLAILLETLKSPSFIGYPGLRWLLLPSTSPKDPGFNPRSYWRGPVWPVIDWLLWWALGRSGELALAERVRESSLEQIAEGGFAEYFEPFTGEPLGSREQSWTAAVALDWLASGPQREMPAVQTAA
jgi:glucosylglycerate hydrolase